MRFLRILLSVILIAATVETAQAQFALPSDVGVTLTASPTTNLQPGQPIDMTLTVTNYGPADVPILFVESSMFADEMYFVSTNWDECLIDEIGADPASGPETFIAEWDLAGFSLWGTLPPFPPGSATCHFQIALTSNAPPIYQFSFGLSALEPDPNPTNDVATVTLQRAPAPPPTPLPTLSTWMLLLLAGLSAGLAANALKRSRCPA